MQGPILTFLREWISNPKNWVKLAILVSAILTAAQPWIAASFPPWVGAGVTLVLLVLHQFVPAPAKPDPNASLIETVLAWIRDGAKDVADDIAPAVETEAQALQIVKDLFAKAKARAEKRRADKAAKEAAARAATPPTIAV